MTLKSIHNYENRSEINVYLNPGSQIIWHVKTLYQPKKSIYYIFMNQAKKKALD